MKRIYLSLFLAACFSLAMLAQLNGSGFYRLRNSVTGSYLKIVCDTINAQKIVAGLSNLTTDQGKRDAMNRVEPFLQTDINMIDDESVSTDPGTVIYLEKQSGGNYDIISQGVGLKYISTCVYVGDTWKAKANGLNGMTATINNINGTNLYTAYVNLYLYIDLLLTSYEMDETRFLGVENGNVVMTSVDNSTNYNGAPTSCRWYIEPLNLTDNYFAVAPVSSFTQNGKYYTTLRTAFSYKVPSGSDVKVYKVTGMPTVDGELAETEEVTQGKVIPAGLPIIIESTSLEPANNKLEPFFNSSSAPIVKSTASFSPTPLVWGKVTDAQINVTGITDSDVLYKGYGHHGHDAYSDDNHNNNSTTGYGSKLWPGWNRELDNLGFFKSKYYDVGGKKWVNTYCGTIPIYKLGIKDGAVGFWDLVDPNDTISGNEAYSPVQCQLFPVEKELADIAEDGKEGISYDVIDNYLYGVKVLNGKLYAKDYGKFRYPDNNTNDAIDGMGKFYGYNEDYDQSNWVVLDVANASSYVNKDLHVIGKLVDRQNPEIKVAKIETTSPLVSSYQLNTYSPASFMGTQTSTVNGKTYFFVKPKPQELVHISWAIYGGDNKFYVNKPGNGINDAQIKGGFVASGDMLPQGASMSDFEVGKAYEFDAVVRVNEVSAGPSLLDEPYTDGGASSIYTVYPYANISDTPTGVERLESGAQVVSVKYYNMMGVESDVPFKGINIMVTNYDNGISTRSKILK